MMMLGPEQQFYCQSVCSDRRNYELKVNDARRINYMLNRIISSKNINRYLKNKPEVNFHHFKTNTHFMCGHCTKVDTFELNLLERELIDNCNIIKTHLETVDNNKVIKQETLRLLQGHYPKLYRWFER